MLRRAAPYVVVVSVLFGLIGARYAERVALYVNPSPERAYEYGIRHIDEPTDRAYNLRDAAYFFKKTIELDPAYPLALHQLGRIAFLEGRYEEALAYETQEIESMGAEKFAAPYYTRALVYGYLGEYSSAVRDYRVYVSLHPEGWEGRTDLAWALIKTHAFEEALLVIDEGLSLHPGNPWLLSVRATALYELKRYDEALDAIRAAEPGIASLTESDWHEAYPGNSPEAARVGLETLRRAHQMNMSLIEAAARRI